jgi:hypothetical protein
MAWGCLSYESVVKRDYPVVLGTLYLFTCSGLLGKLLTDISYVLVDPRIQFESERDESPRRDPAHGRFRPSQRRGRPRQRAWRRFQGQPARLLQFVDLSASCWC